MNADTDPITQAELIELFGSEMPWAAYSMIWETPGDMTLGEVRAKLRAMAREKKIWRNVNDDFVGVEIGHYETLEGKKGLVLQQIGTRVVHVYGHRFLERVQT